MYTDFYPRYLPGQAATGNFLSVSANWLSLMHRSMPHNTLDRISYRRSDIGSPMCVRIHVAVCLTPFALLLAGCTPWGIGPGGEDTVSPPAPKFDVELVVVDEAGLPVEAVEFQRAFGEGLPTETPDVSAGRFMLRGLDQPTLLVVRASGFLERPVVVDREDTGQPVTVRLLARTGPNGERRVVFHFAGDTMLARRYIKPARDGTAVVVHGDGGRSAGDVVAAVAPLYRAADARSLNLESVLGTRPLSAAYPGKRFLIQSPPETVALMDELHVDLVNLASNHLRDWLDEGVQSTTSLLNDAGLAHLGAGTTEDEAATPRILEVAGYRVGFLSYTSVNGDFVNDALPKDDDPVPGDLAEEDAWQYEFRMFSFAYDDVVIASALRRPGTAWALIEEAEDNLSPAGQAELWAAGADMYPELQDWVARRGHGGANRYSASRLEGDVQGLRDSGCALVVAQFHSGFQYAEVKSELIESAAHHAIDAGVDLVIGHHPHVLQGFEWYKGKLIAHSLGNFVFDQDFLVTFSSAVLRVVFHETELLQAEVFPVVLDDYRPAPASGKAARDILQMMHERSALGIRSERVDGAVRTMLRSPDAEAVAARLIATGHTGRIEVGPAATYEVTVEGAPDETTVLPGPALTRTRGPGGAALSNVLLGGDLLRWGSFEDLVADERSSGDIHWATNDSYERIEVLPDAPSGVRCLRLRRTERNESNVITSPVARIPIPRHRIYEERDGLAVPADGEPQYSVQFQGRLDSNARAFLRLDVYALEDEDPTAEPESVRLRTQALDVPISADDQWHRVLLDLPAEVFAATDELDAEAVLLYVDLSPPDTGEAILFVDNLEFIEWRAADTLPDGFHAFTSVRTVNEPRSITLVRTAE